MSEHIHDLVGIGVGPFNLSLAALADEAGVDALFLEREPRFDWHPGLLLEGATLQVPFLADLVTLVHPTSKWSYLNYLTAHSRQFGFYFEERWLIERREYIAYCRWVAEHLDGCRFGHHVTGASWDESGGFFLVRAVGPDGPVSFRARALSVGIGTEPVIPAALAGLSDTRVIHAANYLHIRDDLADGRHVTVVGAGQSGAEVLLDLLRRRMPGRERLAWLARTPSFAPMEYSKLGLEHFTPDYTRYFHSLPDGTRRRLIAEQWQLYKGISAETMSEIHQILHRRSLVDEPDVTLSPGVEILGVEAGPRLRVTATDRNTGGTGTFETDALVCATGYRPRDLRALFRDTPYATTRSGAPVVDLHQRLGFPSAEVGPVYVHNAEHETHGVGTPDLGLCAWRAGTILNDLLARTEFPVEGRFAFTGFGLDRRLFTEEMNPSD